MSLDFIDKLKEKEYLCSSLTLKRGDLVFSSNKYRGLIRLGIFQAVGQHMPDSAPEFLVTSPSFRLRNFEMGGGNLVPMFIPDGGIFASRYRQKLDNIGWIVIGGAMVVSEVLRSEGSHPSHVGHIADLWRPYYGVSDGVDEELFVGLKRLYWNEGGKIVEVDLE